MITVSNEITANLSVNEAILDDNSPESAAWCPNIASRTPPRIQVKNQHVYINTYKSLKPNTFGKQLKNLANYMTTTAHRNNWIFPIGIRELPIYKIAQSLHFYIYLFNGFVEFCILIGLLVVRKTRIWTVVCIFSYSDQYPTPLLKTSYNCECMVRLCL